MNCSCNKRAYPTRAAARVGYNRLLAGGAERHSANGRLHLYPCGNVWHIGHAPLQLVVMHRRRRVA